MIAASSAPVVIAASVNRACRRITAHFMAQHAISPGDAVRYVPGSPIERRQFERMLASGVVKRGVQDSYWLDTAAYTEDSRSRRARLATFAGLTALLLAVILLFFYQG